MYSQVAGTKYMVILTKARVMREDARILAFAYLDTHECAHRKAPTLVILQCYRLIFLAAGSLEGGAVVVSGPERRLRFFVVRA